jgi:hypothetical protein
MSDEAIPEGLTPANQNPWYVLMTLYGEQDGDEINWELAEKNRKAWNAWVGQALSEEEKKAAAVTTEVDVAELSTWSERESAITSCFNLAWVERNPETQLPLLPNPAQEVSFYRNLFSKSCDFSRFVFPRIKACHCTFQSELVFARGRFTGRADFSGSIFSGSVFFPGANFQSDSSFNDVRFNSSLSMDGAQFLGHSYFARAEFRPAKTDQFCRYSFRSCEFSKPASFWKAVFASHYPDLAGHGLHERTEFTTEKGGWPRVQGHAVWSVEYHFPQQPVEDARASCAVIRHLLTKQGLPEDAHFFFRREMHYAGRSGPCLARMPYLLYGAVSDYGYSILRPLIGLALVLFAMTWALWGQTLPDCPPAWQHALSNLLNFLGYLRLYYPGCAESLSPQLKAWSGAQTFASYLLLFFLGLGLRQRFRLR